MEKKNIIERVINKQFLIIEKLLETIEKQEVVSTVLLENVAELENSAIKIMELARGNY